MGLKVQILYTAGILFLPKGQGKKELSCHGAHDRARRQPGGEEERAHLEESNLRASERVSIHTAHIMQKYHTEMHNSSTPQQRRCETISESCFQARVQLLGKVTLTQSEFMSRNYMRKFSGQQENPSSQQSEDSKTLIYTCLKCSRKLNMYVLKGQIIKAGRNWAVKKT